MKLARTMAEGNTSRIEANVDYPDSLGAVFCVFPEPRFGGWASGLCLVVFQLK